MGVGAGWEATSCTLPFLPALPAECPRELACRLVIDWYFCIFLLEIVNSVDKAIQSFASLSFRKRKMDGPTTSPFSCEEI